MEKIIALLLAVLMLFALCGCNGDEGKSVGGSVEGETSSETPLTTIDIIAQLSIGRFPEFNIGLGSVMGDVRAEYGNQNLSYSAQNEMHVLSGNSNIFYMEKNSYLVIAIFTEKHVFGLADSVTPDQIVKHLGEPKSASTPDISKFDPYGNISGADTWMQVYESGENTMVFYYLGGTIHSTLIYKTSDFTMLG